MDDLTAYVHKKLLKKNLFEIANSIKDKNMKFIHTFTKGNFRECNKLLFTIFEICEYYDMWLCVLREEEVGLIEDILTTKYAGHEQLSFKYHSMDMQRVQALLKHDNLSMVKEVIVKKVEVLKKGAIKHNNLRLITFCKDIEKLFLT
jgi:hypothetical protein